MALTSKWYAAGLKYLADGDLDWTVDTIKVSAHAAAYTPNQSTHDFYDDLTNELTTANGYTAGGATLGTKSIVRTALITAFRAADTIWTPAGGETLTIRTLVVRKDTGVAGTSPLLGYIQSDADISATAAAWTSNWDDTDGVLKLTAL